MSSFSDIFSGQQAYGQRKSFTKGFSGLLAFVLMTALLRIWDGYVVKSLWNWFIPTTFHGLPRLGMAQAIGISMVIGYLTLQAPAEPGDQSFGEIMFKSTFFSILIGLVALITGAIVHSYL